MPRAQRPIAASNQGFSLLEATLVLVVVGILLGIGLLSWSSFADSRRYSKTNSQLMQMKDCLVRCIVFTEHYPREDDFKNCRDLTGKDAWGGDIKWIVGTNSTGEALDENHAVVTDEARNQTAEILHSTRTITTANGNFTSVAFALVSLGEDGEANSSTYNTLNSADWLKLSDQSPDFSAAADDLVLVVTGYELAATIKNAVGP